MEKYTIILLALLLVGTIIYIFYREKSSYRLIKEAKMMLDSSNDFIMIWKTDLSYFKANSFMQRNIATNGKELDASIVLEIFGMNTTIKDFSASELLSNAVNTSQREAALINANNDNIRVLWNSKVISTKKGVHKIISIGKDVTSQYKLKQEIDALSKKTSIFQDNYYIAIESAGIGIISIVAENYIYNVHLSSGGKKLLGFSDDEEITLEKLENKVHFSDINTYNFQINRILVGLSESLTIDAKLEVAPNVFHDFVIKFKSKKNKNGDIVRISGAYIDITTQKENYRLYDKTAFEDELTGLPNRRKFMLEGNNFLNNMKRTGKKASVSLIDLDNFQRVNTLFGFETGDKVLKWFASALNEFVSKDLLVARTGADDFAVVMFCDSEREVRDFSEKLRITLEKNIISDTLKEQVNFRLGSCFFNEDDEFSSVYSKAYIALVSGRKSGLDKIVFYNDEVEKQLFERENLENEIAEALRRNEFELYYQPKISFKTGKIVGLEALMRWNHPTRGVVTPNVFISVAEEIGLITKIDEWGLKEACRQNKIWQEKGFSNIKVSVNISQAQLYQTDIYETVKNTLDETQLEAKWLELEITETMAMKDIDHTISTLKKLKSLGVSISMDDFGTGYSSLSSLKSMPIDILKIDRSLVYDVQENNTSKHITSAIITLGKAMNLVTLAEGVETKEQGEFLSDLGCDLAQGYYYGRPQTVDSIEEMFQRQLDMESQSIS